MNNSLAKFSSALTLLTLMTLVGCGGGSSSSTASSGSSAATAVTDAKSTTSSALVVPVTLKWGSTSVFSMGFNVKTQGGVAVADASITLYTYTQTGPNDDTPLDEAVALEAIDLGITDSTGKATFSARIPAYLESVLVVTTKGNDSVKQIVQLDTESPAVNIVLGQ
jgi:ABC-type Fe3+-hydroxamate transport system substrate-binding protein